MEFFSGDGVVRGACCGVEDAEVVVDFCGCGDGGAWVYAAGFLFDGDGWGEAFDGVYIWFLELV